MNRYDEQIQRLTLNPALIKSEWEKAIGLFKYVEPYPLKQTNRFSGDLLMIRQNPKHFKAMPLGDIDEDFTQMIATDRALPKHWVDVTPEALQVMKKWWNLLDPMIDKIKETL